MTGIQYVFSEDGSRSLEQYLIGYLKGSRAHCALLMSKSGHLITQAGFTADFNVQSISALIGGIFSSTQALARLVAEERFKVMYLEGGHWNVYFVLLADHFILATLFDKSTVVGLVRNAAFEAGERMEPLLAQAVVPEAAPAEPAAETPRPLPAEEPSLPDFNRAVEDALSKLFG